MMNKRILSLVLAFVMVLGSVGIAGAATGNTKVDWLIEKGLVTGDEGGYRLNDKITRAEVSAMVVRADEQEAVAKTLQAITSRFTDMNLSNVLWARGYVNFVDGQGIVNGYPGGTFGPNKPITYAEVIKILVMINGDLPDTTGYSGGLWAVPYITKAVSVGITEGVTIPNNDYNGIATREKVFEMVYNTMIKKVGAEQEAYKGIVVENSRVSGIDTDEIALVVFAKGDNAAGATLRYEKDSEIRVTLPASLDAESLLGKVVDITIDKNNNAIKVVVDSSYSYFNGAIAASEDEVYLEANGGTYDVYLEDRFTNSIDRIYGVYHNDEDYEYDDFVADLDNSDGTNDDTLVLEFAKVTVKGNRTFFIDSFTFDDIAPVKEVKKSGEEVYVYDDMVAAGVSEYNLDEVFGFTAQGFKMIEVKDIKADNVIHVYDSDKAIVRQDAEDSGQYDAIRATSGVYYAEIDGTRYQLRNSSYKRPVYSLDGSKFFTLLAASSSATLVDLEDEDITFLLDLNGHVQLIKGELEFSEGVVVLDKVDSRNVAALDGNATLKNYKPDNFSRFFIANSSTPRVLADFSRGDIAYLFNDGTVIDTLVKMATAANVNTSAVKVAKTSRGAFDINLNNSWIKLESGVIEFTNNTNVFIVEVEGSAVTRLEGSTMENIAETAKPGTDLRAYVITEKGFNDLNVGNEIRVGNATDVAHTIIFTDYELDDELLQAETIQLTFNYDSDDEIIGEDIDGDEVEYVVASFANIPDLDSGDIVTVYLDDSEKVVDVDVRIDGDNEVYEVLDIDRSASKIRSITVEIDGEEEIIFVSSNVIIFGDSDIRDGDDVAFAVDEDGDIIVIAVY